MPSPSSSSSPSPKPRAQRPHVTRPDGSTWIWSTSSSSSSWTGSLSSDRTRALSSSDDDDDDDGGGGEKPRVDDRWGVLDAPYKMVLCVNMDLRDDDGKPTKMRPGKMAAQCCHACLGAYKAAKGATPSAVRSWSITGQAKVCVKVPTEAEFFRLKDDLEEAGICYYVVEDAGRTQVAPGSRTVLAVGPAPVKVLDKFTSHFKLY